MAVEERRDERLAQLTDVQLHAYRSFLGGSSILDDKLNAGVDALRKICNHPDLARARATRMPATPPYGAWQASAKLRVLDRLLAAWHHKALLFAQTRQMLDIVERFVRERNYLRVSPHGRHNADWRAPARIDQFNNDDDVFLFVLTTKVGGLGVNLIGADRIVIVDPTGMRPTCRRVSERGTAPFSLTFGGGITYATRRTAVAAAARRRQHAQAIVWRRLSAQRAEPRSHRGASTF